VASKLFGIWCLSTVALLILVETLSPFGPNIFDPADIAAGIAGAVLAFVVFHGLVRHRLTFGGRSAATPAYPVSAE